MRPGVSREKCRSGVSVVEQALATLAEAEQQCLSRFPDRVEPQLMWVRSLRAQGRTDEALEALADAEVHGATP